MFQCNNLSKRNWLCIFAVVMVNLGQSGFAAGTGAAFRCDIVTHGFGGWTPNDVVFRFRELDSKVTVLDGMINHELGRPVTVSVKNRRRGIKSFRWTLSTGAVGGKTINVTQRIDFDPVTLTGRIFTNHRGYSGEPLGGTLSCKPYKGNLV